MSQPISDRLRALRKRQGLTQDQLAQQLFVSRQTISHWENGRSTPDYETLKSLADLFGVSTAEMLGEDVPEPAPPAQPDPPPQPEPSSQPAQRRPKWPIAVAAALLCLLCAWLLWPKPPEIIAPPYPIEWFEQAYDPVEGQPFVQMVTYQSPILRTRTKDDSRYCWTYQLYLREKNGVKIYLDFLESYTYFDDGSYSLSRVPAEDFSFAGSTPFIAPGSSRSLTMGENSNQPILGNGLILNGHTEDGTTLAFRAFIPFSTAYKD